MRIAIFLILTGIILSCGNHPDVIRTNHQPSQLATLAVDSLSDREADSDASLKEGLALFRTGNYERAQTLFEKSLEENYRNWKAHYYLGLTLRLRDMPDQALAALHHGLRLAPDDPRARSRIYVAIGEVSESTGAIGKARISFMTALQIWPESDSARDGLARLENLDPADSR
ncbi:MAG TPA: tetratricopeptide repeat protein [candidate division Zixibacteria bacterium]|nr:tetratricopeptide repeat protein [candidate division Zixibacteria bacterium]